MVKNNLLETSALSPLCVKFMILKKAIKNDEIFTVDLTLCSKHQIDGEDFVNFHGLLRKCELYLTFNTSKVSSRSLLFRKINPALLVH